MRLAGSWRVAVAACLVVGACGALTAVPVNTDDQIGALFSQYKAGHFSETSRGLSAVRDWPAFAQRVKQERQAWPPMPAAAFLLEASCTAVLHHDPPISKKVDSDLLRAAEDAARAKSIVPSFTRTWFLAAIACRERATYLELPTIDLQSADLLQQAAEVLKGDPVMALAAIRQNERLLSYHWLGFGAIRAANPNPTSLWEGRAKAEAPELLTKLATEFERLRDPPEVAAEATVRAGFWRMMAGNPTRALTLFGAGASAAASRSDRRYTYLAAFLAARALAILERHDEAIASAREALAIWPTADSARSLLAAELYARGDRDQAAAIVMAMLSSAHSADDPWRDFPLGDGYLWPDRLAALRRQMVTH